MVTGDKYVWTESGQLEEIVICEACDTKNDPAQLYCENCDQMLIETDEDLTDEFIAERTGQRVGTSPRARAERNGRFFDKLIWFFSNWIYLLLLSVMTLSASIGVVCGIIALMWWHFEDGSVYVPVVLLSVGFGTLLLFDLFNRFGVFDWIYCESAF